VNEKFAQYRGRLTQFWSQMGKKQKIWLGASVAGILVAVILLTVVFTRTEYETAFKNLDMTDAAAIVAYLDGAGITYELSPNGDSIAVPSAVAAKVKMDVGSQGLVQNGSLGLDAFGTGSSAFGTTENVFNAQYLNAMNGEVQKLLNMMQGVQKSNVLINMPKESVFLSTEEANAASASIVLEFVPGYRPAQKDIDGYYNLVKTAVPNIKTTDITISSSQLGELISSETSGVGTGVTDAVEKQFQIQRSYETELKKEIQQFLGPMVGANNLVISVSSSLNFDKKQSSESLVSPLPNNSNNGIIVSEELTSNSSTNTNGGVGGVVGTGETDIAGYDASATSGESSSESSSTIRNYDFNRVNNIIESGPFVVKDLSISIGVESQLLNDGNRDAIQNYLVQLVRAQLASSGADVNDDVLMGKKVSVIAQTFAEGIASSAAGGINRNWLIGIGVAALAIIGALGFMLVRRRKQQETDEDIVIAENTKVEYPTLDFDQLNNDSQARKNLETLAKRKPDEFVNLLRTWLVDE